MLSAFRRLIYCADVERRLCRVCGYGTPSVSTVRLLNVLAPKRFRWRTVYGDAGLAGVVFQMCTVGYVAFRSHTVEGAAGAVCREAFRVCAGEG